VFVHVHVCMIDSFFSSTYWFILWDLFSPLLLWLCLSSSSVLRLLECLLECWLSDHKLL
jgi:hypothetical protein